MSGDTMLTKKQVTVQRIKKSNMPCFIVGHWSGVAEGDASAAIHVDLCADDWEAMDSPDQITVTIEPGDRLND